MSDASDAAEIQVICGPTASGKSTLALSLAERLPSTIVSADSRQVYRRFDIGTAKPTAGEQARVPHAGIDLVDPTERYSAAAWAEEADRAIACALESGRTPIVVGGTGLYLRALFEGLFDEPPLDEARRLEIQRLLDPLPVPELRRWAAALDPARAHLGRTQLLRAVEIALLTGHRLSTLHAAGTRRPRWRPRYLLVDPGPELSRRIEVRLDAMLESGWPEEVRALLDEVPGDAPAWKATGYRHVREYVLGRKTKAETRESILIETRQYAKRQRTWFRHQLPPDATTGVAP